MNIDVRPIDAETAAAISQKIPELTNPHAAAEYLRRTEGKISLFLGAYINGEPAGFKAGYDKFEDGSFYSWMGGVLPAYRKNGVAKTLADAQEKWAIRHGFHSIVFKTRNRHKAMLMFALSNGFSIISVEPHDILEEYRILLKKPLPIAT